MRPRYLRLQTSRVTAPSEYRPRLLILPSMMRFLRAPLTHLPRIPPFQHRYAQDATVINPPLLADILSFGTVPTRVFRTTNKKTQKSGNSGSCWASESGSTSFFTARQAPRLACVCSSALSWIYRLSPVCPRSPIPREPTSQDGRGQTGLGLLRVALVAWVSFGTSVPRSEFRRMENTGRNLRLASAPAAAPASIYLHSHLHLSASAHQQPRHCRLGRRASICSTYNLPKPLLVVVGISSFDCCTSLVRAEEA
ncbi:hypothetical protein LZ32DRAFT_317741 [Colletotrichum eremochloae]|nr:hypothetical protein LZ32DRAFT_317741 [Colletotrichum eremochloae]